MDVSQMNAQLEQIHLEYEPSYEVLFTYMDQSGRVPCFNPSLIKEIAHYQQMLETLPKQYQDCKVKYVVAASKTPGVFNLGGDLELIRELIVSQDRDKLHQYAIDGLNIMYQRLNRFQHKNMITLSLLQGKTLGAGLEAALTSDIVIAEKQATLSFPEIIFNMFPGMGGYSLAARKIGPAKAKDLILKGSILSAQEAYDIGLVDILAEDGKGEDAVYDWIKHHKRNFSGMMAFQKVQSVFDAISYQELVDITHIWEETALHLSGHDLSIMTRFVKRQQQQYLGAETTELPRLQQIA